MKLALPLHDKLYLLQYMTEPLNFNDDGFLGFYIISSSGENSMF